MDAAELNGILHQKNNYYKIKVGEDFSIDLPKIPLTGDTEFLQLTTESNASNCAVEYKAEENAEGNLIPSMIKGKGLSVGKKVYTVRLINALTKQEIEGVDPLRIILEVVE